MKKTIVSLQERLSCRGRYTLVFSVLAHLTACPYPSNACQAGYIWEKQCDFSGPEIFMHFEHDEKIKSFMGLFLGPNNFHNLEKGTPVQREER